MGQLETTENDRPVYPPKILSVEVLDNPFDDILPRDLKAPQRQAEEEAKRKQRKPVPKYDTIVYCIYVVYSE